MQSQKPRPDIENKRLSDYLRFFINMPEAPEYAVLINGEWGSGKTWFINKLRQENPDQKFLYVSLYGISSTSEIEDQFFQQLHPILASKPFSIGAKILKSVLKTTINFDIDGDKKPDGNINATIPDIKFNEIVSDSEKRILIFDDLERCKMSPEEILGYINTFVEHQKQKVIILGYEKEIPNIEEYRKKSEKIIGRRFSLVTDIGGALLEFTNLVNDERLKEILKREIELIVEIYRRAEYNNLRTLKHSLLEYERFFFLLPEKAQENQDFQKECINTFFSLSIEIRRGRIKTSDIKGLHDKNLNLISRSISSKNKDIELDSIEEAYTLHFGSTIQQISPSEEVMHSFFEYGFVQQQLLEASIEANQIFVDQNTPTWKRLLFFIHLQDSDFEKYSADVIENLKNYKYTNPGELKHVCSMLNYFSTKEMLSLTNQEVQKLIESVLEYMTKNNLIDVLRKGEEEFFRFNESYAGIAFFDSKSDFFRKLTSDLEQYNSRRMEEYVKSTASDILDLMKKDSIEFCDSLIHSNQSNRLYLEHPVLSYIDPNQFVSTFIEVEPRDRQAVYSMFRQRYAHLNSTPELKQEQLWLKQLSDQIKSRMPGLKHPTKFSVDELDKILNSLIEQFEKI